MTTVRRDAPVQALGCFATVTAEPAQNGPILFNEKPSCFSEMTEQNCKSCSQSLSRGENLDLHLEPKPPPHPTPPPTHTHRTKGLRRNWNLNTKLFQKQRDHCSGRSCIDILYHKGPSSKVTDYNLFPALNTHCQRLFWQRAASLATHCSLS